MSIGSVTVDEDGDVTGSGATKRLTDNLLAMPSFAALLDGLGESQKQQIVQGMADMAGAIVDAILTEITDNAEVTQQIGTSDSALQRMPADPAENNPTKAPSSTRTLSIKGTVA